MEPRMVPRACHWMATNGSVCACVCRFVLRETRSDAFVAGGVPGFALGGGCDGFETGGRTKQNKSDGGPRVGGFTRCSKRRRFWVAKRSVAAKQKLHKRLWMPSYGLCYKYTISFDR
mmetsp:Transcript_116293/g.237887  ORF Transcript_116293/g.237887 Transcript_116293/m.237887 type:complete len:117 (-) Transcript_116293:2316-2666(-)